MCLQMKKHLWKIKDSILYDKQMKKHLWKIKDSILYDKTHTYQLRRINKLHIQSSTLIWKYF
jgi:hypothetical protein